MFSKTATALIFAAAIGIALPTVNLAMNGMGKATKQFGKPTTDLVMTVQRGETYDDYIMDHDMSLGDCYDALRPSYIDQVADTNVSVTYACEVR